MTSLSKNQAYNSCMGRKLIKPRNKRGEHLLGLRMNAGLSQEDLSQRVGVSQQTIAFWERTGTLPRSESLPHLADALGVTMEALLSEKDTIVAVKKKGGPTGKVRTVFEEVSRLPRRQQEKVVEFVSAFVKQHAINAMRS